MINAVADCLIGIALVVAPVDVGALAEVNLMVPFHFQWHLYHVQLVGVNSTVQLHFPLHLVCEHLILDEFAVVGMKKLDVAEKIDDAVDVGALILLLMPIPMMKTIVYYEYCCCYCYYCVDDHDETKVTDDAFVVNLSDVDVDLLCCYDLGGAVAVGGGAVVVDVVAAAAADYDDVVVYDCCVDLTFGVILSLMKVAYLHYDLYDGWWKVVVVAVVFVDLPVISFEEVDVVVIDVLSAVAHALIGVY